MGPAAYRRQSTVERTIITMLISASRRTDIPAFFAPWFMNRLRSGFCLVPNPFYPKQIQRVSLQPLDVEAICFWTRDPRPIFPYLDEIETLGYRYNFLITLMDNPAVFDPGLPPLRSRLKSFQKLSVRIGPLRVTWRYDPIVLSNITVPDFHINTYQSIASALKGYTACSIISFVDIYRKNKQRLEQLKSKGIEIYNDAGSLCSSFKNFLPQEYQSMKINLLQQLADVAAEHNIRIQTCAEAEDFSSIGIPPGKCIDGQMLSAVYQLDICLKKDPSQRRTCGCVISKDIGMYNTCPRNCVYCYATANINQSVYNYKRHDPASPSLIPL